VELFVVFHILFIEAIFYRGSMSDNKTYFVIEEHFINNDKNSRVIALQNIFFKIIRDNESISDTSLIKTSCRTKENPHE
jgi:hypothetical protein